MPMSSCVTGFRRRVARARRGIWWPPSRHRGRLRAGDLPQALVADRWKPEKGASPRTYFLGGCVLAFPNVLRHWENDRRRYQVATAAWAPEQATRESAVEPVDMVYALDALESLTRDESDRANGAYYSTEFQQFLLPCEAAANLGDWDRSALEDAPLRSHGN
ncbi:hypothetical protein ACIQUM_08075 [Amycolatopsis azurea]|uniref:hypothetical protein n=1 Tax=Amycolatopsis azurea TaxID=36819 RepID=UPI003829BF0D